MNTWHYGTDEWLAYKLRNSETAKTADMEAHLLVCESCQEIYLDLIEQQDSEQAQYFIPSGFTDSLIERLEIITPPPKMVKLAHKKQFNRKGIFAYYVTAAAVTLALMSGGVFDSMVDQSVRFSNICMMQSQSIESKVGSGWSSQILKNGSLWMQNQSFNKERNVKNAK